MPDELTQLSLSGKTILVTGGVRRLGKAFSLAIARAGGNIVLHHGHSTEAARKVAEEIHALGRDVLVLQADLADPLQTQELIARAYSWKPLFALVNSAAIFEPLRMAQTDLASWQRHMAINLTAPFLLSQAFSTHKAAGEPGRIINILDWRALRPGLDHFPYTISKSSLAALTRAMAVALSPDIVVNGLALGAILPPSDGSFNPALVELAPAHRWAEPGEVEQALLFLLAGPAYITGEILHVDGGRHLV